MVSRKEWYQRVNSVWPEVMPTMTNEEAIRAARKLYRFIMRRKLNMPIKITSGNRYNWPHGGILYLNPTTTRHGGAWKALVHELSHWLHNKISPDRPHDKSHARLELKMAKEVVKRGWLTGSLKTPDNPDSPKPDQRLIRHQSILKRIEVWKSKKKRAERALAKLSRQSRYYERSVAQ